MKLISLPNSSRPAIVDDDDYERVKNKAWRLLKVSGGEYVAWKTHKKGKDITLYLQRQIMGNPVGMMIDHINGDIYDNRKQNLRVATNSQNQMNSKKRVGGTSRYKGVSWNTRRGAWKAQIRVDGQDFFLGYFHIERHAAEAVELSRPILHAEYARSNFSLDEIALMYVDA